MGFDPDICYCSYVASVYPFSQWAFSGPYICYLFYATFLMMKIISEHPSSQWALNDPYIHISYCSYNVSVHPSSQ